MFTFSRRSLSRLLCLQITAFCVTASGLGIAHAADGQLDSSFGNGGKVTTAANLDTSAAAVVIQSDGKIIAVGSQQTLVVVGFGTVEHFLLVRYMPSGALDTSFGNGGKVVTTFIPNPTPSQSDSSDNAYAILLQSDGKIVVVGSTSFYHANNQFDRDFAIARYNADGSLDSTFGDHGLVITDLSGGPDEAYALTLQPDGKIVVGGTAATGRNPNTGAYNLAFALSRYTTNGTLDSTFGSGGKVLTAIPVAIHGVAIQSDRKIVAGGDVPWTLARFDASGNLDPSFGSGGKVTSFIENGGRGAMAIALQTDGKIVAAGYQTNFVVARYGTDGTLDSTFGNGGKITTTFKGGYDLAFALTLQNDAKIIVAGQADNGHGYDFALARYGTNGSLDSTFGNAGKATVDFSSGEEALNGMAIQKDGKIVVAGVQQDSTGKFTFALARFTGTAFNSIDESGFFVRRHYFDFLNRDADQSGLDFWLNTINGCGSDQACIEVKRINASGAFFLSIEFQETGYLVYRVYKSAFGNIASSPVPVRLEEFLPDLQQIGSGVIVNQGNWQAQLEANKMAFTQAFVQRSRFITAYPTTMTPTAFVDQLFLRAGVTPSSTLRNAAVAEFGAAANTTDNNARARALRDVAENPTLNQQEVNRAFVLMQYFGYLRRNPYDPPEITLDYSGFNFWLSKLNGAGGDYIKAEMVKAFISSDEYRHRFGP